MVFKVLHHAALGKCEYLAFGVGDVLADPAFGNGDEMGCRDRGSRLRMLCGAESNLDREGSRGFGVFGGLGEFGEESPDFEAEIVEGM